MRIRKKVIIYDGHWMLHNQTSTLYYAYKEIPDGTDDVVWESTDVWFNTIYGSRREEAEKHYEEENWKLTPA